MGVNASSPEHSLCSNSGLSVESTSQPKPWVWLEKASGEEGSLEDCSAERWDHHSSQESFLASFQGLVSAPELSVDELVQSVEAFLLVEAQKPGMIRACKPFKPHNPN